MEKDFVQYRRLVIHVELIKCEISYIAPNATKHAYLLLRLQLEYKRRFERCLLAPTAS